MRLCSLAGAEPVAMRRLLLQGKVSEQNAWMSQVTSRARLCHPPRRPQRVRRWLGCNLETVTMMMMMMMMSLRRACEYASTRECKECKSECANCTTTSSDFKRSRVRSGLQGPLPSPPLLSGFHGPTKLSSIGRCGDV